MIIDPDINVDIVITTTAPGGLVVTMTLPIGDFFGGSPSATGDAEGLAETGNGSDDNGDNGSSDRNGGGNSNGSDDEIDSDNSNRGGSSGRGGRGRKGLIPTHRQFVNQNLISQLNSAFPLTRQRAIQLCQDWSGRNLRPHPGRLTHRLCELYKLLHRQNTHKRPADQIRLL